MLAMVGAFVRRDALIWSSYRLAMVWRVFGLVGLVAMIYLIGKTAGDRGSFTEHYGTDYAGYLMTSIAFLDVWAAGFLLSRGLRENQAAGTLEAMMLAHFGIIRLLVYSAAFPVLQSLLRLSVFVVIAVVMLGLWHGANIPAAALVFITALAVMICIGTLSVAFTLVLKQGDPVIAVYGLFNALLSGVFFPRDVMPHWLQMASLFFPMTYALDGMRRALHGESLLAVAPQVAVLGALFLALAPITVWATNWALRRAKEEGSLVQY